MNRHNLSIEQRWWLDHGYRLIKYARGLAIFGKRGAKYWVDRDGTWWTNAQPVTGSINPRCVS